MTDVAEPFAEGDSTATVTRVVPDQPVTRTIADLVEDVAWLNSQVHDHHQNAAELHSRTSQLHTDALAEMLRTHAGAVASRPLTELLAELGDQGFAWRDIARLVGVSVPALRKWRQGEQATGENRLRVARLVGLCDLLKERGLIDDPASWLELPLVYDVPVSGIDLLAAGRTDLLFRRALHHDTDPEAILDEFDPDWRTTYRGAFEVFEAEDGLPGLRIRDVDG